MAEKITYLFGAGASYNALPLVKDTMRGGKVIKTGLTKSIERLSVVLRERYDKDPVHQNQYLTMISEDLKWLSSESDDFFTVDTLAKYFYINKRKKEYQRLKKCLSFYLDFEQVVNKRFDKRYLNFLISLIDSSLPKDISFLSWNYDVQLELALKRFDLVNKPLSFPIDLKRSNISILTDIPHKISEFRICHLNGVAGLLDQDKQYVQLEHDDISSYLEDFQNIEKTSKKHHLYFAWEEDDNIPFLKDRAFQANQLAAGTTILVVIGYSFPFFNRIVDKKVFEAFKQANSLKKIYFQDPYLDGTFLYNQFGLDKDNVSIIHIKDVSQFFVPFEL